MSEPRPSAVPNHPVVLIPFRRQMKASFISSVALCALLGACASPPPAPPPAPVSQPGIAGPFRMDPTLTPNRVPPFEEGPLIAWGPEPEGVSHAERVRTYDLQHQSTTVRFDWPRHAVVGQTTLQIAGLPGGPALSNVAIDAGD